jgi:hypothetical protein
VTDEEKADERRALAWLSTREYNVSIVQSLAAQFKAIRAEQSAELASLHAERLREAEATIARYGRVVDVAFALIHDPGDDAAELKESLRKSLTLSDFIDYETGERR